uniref:Uncharacterized protein n=1 Tax=Vespula pensylvanica TaxID=30213 RepID=A0A834P2M4_VESPE|nr:hypothetical protein H0235_007980 [Vespula pensylvanica]
MTWRRQEVAKLVVHFGLGRHVRGQVRISKFVKLWNVDWRHEFTLVTVNTSRTKSLFREDDVEDDDVDGSSLEKNINDLSLGVETQKPERSHEHFALTIFQDSEEQRAHDAQEGPFLLIKPCKTKSLHLLILDLYDNKMAIYRTSYRISQTEESPRNKDSLNTSYRISSFCAGDSSLLCSLLENAIVASVGPNLCQVDRVSPARLRIKSNVRELSIPRNGPTFSSLCAVYTDTSRVCAMDSALSSRV